MEWTQANLNPKYHGNPPITATRKTGPYELKFTIHLPHRCAATLEVDICGHRAFVRRGTPAGLKRIGENFDPAQWRRFEAENCRKKIAHLEKQLVHERAKMEWWDVFGFIGLDRKKHVVHEDDNINFDDYEAKL